MYFEHRNEKKKKQEQQEEFLKYRNHYKDQTKNEAPAPHDKMIKLSDVKFDDKNLRNLLTAQRKPKIRRYYDVYSDDGGESGNEFRENESESSNEGIAKKKDSNNEQNCSNSNYQTCHKKKIRKTTKRNYRLYKQLIIIK